MFSPADAPKLPSVSVRPSEVEEGSSVTLTCSSDANPAAQYTWYKEDRTPLHGAGGTYNFPSISSEDEGIYYCECENQFGRINSSSLSLNVQYAPKLPSVSVRPSEVEEGSSVTLTCSSDANPAAQYTWYKDGYKRPSEDSQLFFSSIQSSDSGQYYCSAENKLGKWSASSFIDVKCLTVIAQVSTEDPKQNEGVSLSWDSKKGGYSKLLFGA
ncbi:B-cell receptor CD22-like [Leuresthes tenuis]|uniref:B-cell receptor CD22-like n=1 Tax=Leuresthes tenuis TaxID=355514 RepID=UPI003B50BEB6